MLRNTLPDRRLPKILLQNILKTLLMALDFLHNEAKMIHTGTQTPACANYLIKSVIKVADTMTDLQAGNVHLRIRDTSILEEFEEQELNDPSPRKPIGKSFIFKSRDLAWDQDPGHPILCDFGEARYGKTSYTDPIQPSAYRSPEVMFGVPWTSSVDIWNVGVMVCVHFVLFRCMPAAD
jgi:serine/threonine protein kinase